MLRSEQAWRRGRSAKGVTKMNKQDKAEFKAYCENCTNSQLHNVYITEKTARRIAYANIAKQVLIERGLI